MPASYQPASIEPRQGGALITQESLEDVGPSNYSIKRDWRRSFDAEVRREGDILFQPSAASLNNQPYPETGTPITLVHTCRRANGQIATVVGTQTTLYRYFTFVDGNVYEGAYQNGVYANESSDWYVIGKNYSTSGHRWEAVDVAGYTVFNNGVDLPVYYDISKRFVQPLHELREQGIAAVGTLTTFNGMLLLQDITNMTAAYTTTCLNGVNSGTITASQSGTTVMASSSFFTAAMVGQTLTYNTGFHCKILSYNSATSVGVDTAQHAAAVPFNVAILFGIANDPLQTSRVRYQIINSLVGDPTGLGSLSTAYVTTGSKKITFPQPMYSLKVGDQVIVTGIGVDGSAVTANIIAVDNIFHSFVYIDQLPLENTQNVTFSVSATPQGGSLSYQWNYNGSTIAGATSATYTISNVSPANAGTYNVTIYDSTGSTTSNLTTLTVYNTDLPPIITTQPNPTNVEYGTTATFSVVVQSADTPTYQWTLNGANLVGGNGSIYNIYPVNDAVAGLYACNITNSAGTVTSNSVLLTVVVTSEWVAPTIQTQPMAVTAIKGQAVDLQINATGVPDVSYQWQQFISSVWTNVGVNSNTIGTICASSSNAGTFRCIVTNAAGSVTSASAIVTINNPTTGPIITAQTSEVPLVVFAPADATIQKATYPGSAISSQNLQDDGSAIIRSIDLRGTLVVFKETSIFVGTFTGTAGGPIAYQRVYTGPDCIYWKWMLTEVDGTYVIYATQKDFFTFDLSFLLPRKHPQLRLSSNAFYALGLTSTSEDLCFAVTNELTREIWFMYPSAGPDYGIGFDYEWNTVSTIGASYTACATIDLDTTAVNNDPKRVFALGDSGGTIRVYGLDTETGATYQRNGANYTSTLTGGYVSFNDEYNEKDLRAYIAFCRQLAPFTVTLYGARNAHEPPTTLCTVNIPTPTYQTLIPAFFRQNYFQDQIVVSGTNQNCELVRRLFDASKIESRSTIKHM